MLRKPGMTLAATAAFLLAPTNASALVMLSEQQSIWVPGSMETQPWDINNAGVVVGGYRLHDGGGFHGFIYSAGAFTTVDAPGADSTVFYGINDVGEIVGEAGGSALTTAFKYTGGAFHPIDVPGAAGAVATDVNNAGQVIGNYLTGSLEDGLQAHLFLQTGASIDTFPGSHGAAWSEALADDGSFAGFDNIGFLHHGGGFSDLGTDLVPRGLTLGTSSGRREEPSTASCWRTETTRRSTWFRTSRSPQESTPTATSWAISTTSRTATRRAFSSASLRSFRPNRVPYLNRQYGPCLRWRSL